MRHHFNKFDWIFIVLLTVVFTLFNHIHLSSGTTLLEYFWEIPWITAFFFYLCGKYAARWHSRSKTA